MTGTSFSAPMVAAAAAWLRAAKPNLKVDQIAQTLRGSARDLGARGWDSATGYGLLSMIGALSRATPAADPHEPNDDMAWVDGRALGRVDRAIWRGGRPQRLHALVDKYEDPADVYRIVLPPHAKVRITLKPRFGDPDLAAFTRSATSTADAEQIIGRSRHNGRPQGLADPAQPVAALARGCSRSPTSTTARHARLPLRPQRAPPQAALTPRGAERRPDLPVVAEGVRDPAQPPAVL